MTPHVKKNLLNEIDYAMLDESKRQKLHKEIDKKLKDFKLSIPRTFEGKGQYRVTAW